MRTIATVCYDAHALKPWGVHMKVQIDTHSAYALTAVRRALEALLSHDPAFNGARFDVTGGDSIDVETGNRLLDALVHRCVCDALDSYDARFKSFYFVEDGAARELGSDAEVEAACMAVDDAEISESIVVHATCEADALEIAELWDRGRAGLHNVWSNGRAIPAVTRPGVSQ